MQLDGDSDAFYSQLCAKRRALFGSLVVQSDRLSDLFSQKVDSKQPISAFEQSFVDCVFPVIDIVQSELEAKVEERFRTLLEAVERKAKGIDGVGGVADRKKDKASEFCVELTA